MAHRELIDSMGRRWDVWTVIPAFAERRGTASSAASVPDRRRRDEFRVALGDQWARGWLAFSTSGEHRRLAPYPSNWTEMSDAELEALCRSAVAFPRRGRLIE